MKLILRSNFLFLGILAQVAFVGCEQNFGIVQIDGPAVLSWGQGSTAADTAQYSNESWSSMDVMDIGQAPLGSVSKTFVDVRNSGPRPAQIFNVTTSGGDGTVYSIDNRCSNLVLPGERCRIYTSFTPNNLGKAPGTINVTFNDGRSATNTTTSLPITASANNLAFLKFETSSMTVNTTTLGYTLSVLYKVLYNGTKFASSGVSILPAKGVTITDPNNGVFSIDHTAATTCGDTINADCYIQVNFTPTAVPTQNASFMLSYSNGAEVLSTAAQVSGTGSPHQVLATLSAGSGAFGNVVANPASAKGMAISINFDPSATMPATNISITGPSTAAYTISSNPNLTTCSSSQITNSCQLYVYFNPSVIGTSYPDSISIDYKSNSQARPTLTIPLSGKGVAPAHLTLTPSTTLAFGSFPAHMSNTKSFQLKNDGGAPISVLSPIAAMGATDFNNINFDASCATLAVNATCNLNVTFIPTTANTLSTNLSFSYFDGRVAQNIAVSANGTGTAPLVMSSGSISPSVIDFGYVMIGGPTPAPVNISVSYYGTTSLTQATQLAANPANLSSPFIFPGGPFPGGGNCAAPLNPNTANSCYYTVGLSTNSVGLTANTPMTQTFGFTYAGDNPGGGSGSLSFKTQMTPENPPTLSFVNPGNFGTISVNDSQSVTFTLKNSSPYFWTSFKSISIAGAASSAFSISNNGCNTAPGANGSCSITIKFNPTSAAAFSGTLNYVYNDQISDHTVSTAISGTGTANITLKPSTTTVDFTDAVVYVGDPVIYKTISLNVYGSGSWTASDNSSSPFSITPVSCGASASNCSLKIGFTPTTAGTFNSTVTYTYAPGINNPATLSFSFKGIAVNRSAALAFNTPAFSKTIIGQSSTQTITITNNGTSAANNMSLSIAGTTFFFASNGAPGSSGHCAVSQTLASGASCTIVASFVPGMLGTQTTTINASYTDVASGNPATASANLSGTGTQMIQVFAGAYQSCLINELGQAACWGRNTSGQLGYNHTNAIAQSVQSLPTINVGSGNQILKLALGDAHTCALLKNSTNAGFVSCWGSNDSGRLGLGSSAASSLNPVDANGHAQIVSLGTGEIAVDIAAGFEHTCAALKSGKVKCWGGNTSGQLGTDSTTSLGTSAAQLGDGLAAVNLGGAIAVSVTAGAAHSCAVFKDGTSRCWGDNFYGQLGQGRNDEQIGNTSGGMASLSAISLWSTPIAQSIYASASAFTCVVGTNGEVKCFGQSGANETSSNPFYGVFGYCWARAAHNSIAQSCSGNSSLTPASSLGYLASDMGSNLLPVNLNGIATKQLSVGKYFVCSLGTDASVRCFGLNADGQLGQGTTTNIGTNVSDMGANLRVSLSSVAMLSSGYEHSCAVLQNNTLKCWGSSTLNATGLASIGVTGDTGISGATAPANLTAVYDGR